MPAIETTGKPPAAFMGYVALRPGIGVRVCAWHGAAAKLEAEKWAEPLEVNHSMCEACAASQMAKLLGEQIEASAQ